MYHNDGERGSSYVLTFLVAGAIFVAVIGGLLITSRNAGKDPGGAAQTSTTDTDARSLADLIIASPGIGWAAGPDHVQRLGLGAAGGGLNHTSIEALRSALLSSAANGKVDYPDARTGLGLTGTQDFHLRIYPVALPAIYKETRAGLKTAYIGDWTSLATVNVLQGSSDQMIQAAQLQLNLTMFAQTAKERLALRDLGLDFNDRVFLSTLAPTVLVTLSLPPFTEPLLTALNVPLLAGDVYPDVKQYLDANLAGQLGQYDLLIVGAGVDQSTLTSAVTKYAIRDWVLGGGTLIVMGSSSLNYQWLQPLFDVGVKTANGAATAPDPTHPLLVTPNQLEWTSYSDHGMGWDIKANGANAAYESFNHVIVQGGEDVLAVSEDGGFGKGRIILTTYLPREIATTISQAEAEHLIDNMILYSDRGDLFLEYGPQQPTNMPVSVAVRDSSIPDTRLGLVPMRTELHLWGTPA